MKTKEEMAAYAEKNGHTGKATFGADDGGSKFTDMKAGQTTERDDVISKLGGDNLTLQEIDESASSKSRFGDIERRGSEATANRELSESVPKVRRDKGTTLG